MIRAALVSLALLATPAFAHDDHAEDHEHDHHVAEAEGLRAIHAWANATTGSTALVYVELENTSDTDATLTGAHSDIAASAQLVGLENSGGQLTYTPLPLMPVPAGREIVLSPNGMAIQLTGLTQPLVEGDHFEIEFEFDGLHLDAVVEIESANATQHSHAGHQH